MMLMYPHCCFDFHYGLYPGSGRNQSSVVDWWNGRLSWNLKRFPVPLIVRHHPGLESCFASNLQLEGALPQRNNPQIGEMAEGGFP